MSGIKMFFWEKIKLLAFLLALFLLVSIIPSCSVDGGGYPLPPESSRSTDGWTIMVYLDGDNDLESAAMVDLIEMKSGFNDSSNLDLIVLVDRINGYSTDTSALGENFEGTRLYKITQNTATRLSDSTYLGLSSSGDSDELNMGDASTLKKFIQFCKANYEKTNYSLILWNHGGGVRSKAKSSTVHKAICWDETDSSDSLYTAEISDILTSNESVNLLAFDACLMGSIEVAYQYRKGNGGFEADYMVASAPTEYNNGYDYSFIFGRIKSGSGDNGTTLQVAGTGNELYRDPLILSTLQLGAILVEEQYDSTRAAAQALTESLSCYDLSKVNAVKTAVDTLAAGMVTDGDKADFKTVRGSLTAVDTIHYFEKTVENEWISTPFFDLYDLCDRIAADAGRFEADVRGYADSVMTAVDAMVIYSFAGTNYSGFSNGQNGIHIFAPDGDRAYNGTERHFTFQWWYNSIDTSMGGTQPTQLYGKIKWCIDGATANNGAFENWFEMLDSWYDTGTLNGYTP